MFHPLSRYLAVPALTLLLGSVACEAGHACGDGAVSDGEACDDGNWVSGDGCSAQCQPDDDVRTPGDDRVGYFFCPSEEGSTGISCPPDTLCCVTFGPLCASHEQGCSDPLNMITCDGPEDCGGSTPCRKQPHGTQCSTIDLGSDRCHRDSDCGVFEGVQLSCGALGDCEYPTPPLLGR